MYLITQTDLMLKEVPYYCRFRLQGYKITGNLVNCFLMVSGKAKKKKKKMIIELPFCETSKKLGRSVRKSIFFFFFFNQIF